MGNGEAFNEIAVIFYIEFHEILSHKVAEPEIDVDHKPPQLRGFEGSRRNLESSNNKPKCRGKPGAVRPAYL